MPIIRIELEYWRIVMNSEKWYKKILKSFEDDLDFRLEKIILDITESISKRMEDKRVNRVKLAELLNVSPPAVTKILNGTSNFTLRTLLSLSDVLDLELNVGFKEKGSSDSIKTYDITSEVERATTFCLYSSSTDYVNADIVEIFFSTATDEAVPDISRKSLGHKESIWKKAA